MEETLNNLIQDNGLKWIFVGGKGGVGKTTTACSLSIALSKVRDTVLLLSSDPAHNVSDAFGQKFGRTPSLIQGFTNLYAMEIDPSFDDLAEEDVEDDLEASGGISMSALQGLTRNMPGMDEAKSFASVMRLVRSLQFDLVVFDTPPTGHCLRFLQMGETLSSLGGGMMSGPLGAMFQQMSSMFGAGSSEQMNATNQIVEEVNRQFRDPQLATFVCVAIPEFLSVYETERLIQELAEMNIDCSNIVVNQILPENDDCSHCNNRRKLQKRYMDDIRLLYEEDFHLTFVEEQPGEVRGPEQLALFSELLLKKK